MHTDTEKKSLELEALATRRSSLLLAPPEERAIASGDSNHDSRSSLPQIANVISAAISKTWIGLILMMALLALSAHSGQAADKAKVAELVRQGDELEKAGKTKEALEVFLTALEASPDDAEILIRLAKQHSDLIFETKEKAAQKDLAAKALAFAEMAAEKNPNSARAHLSIAVCCAKNFPFLDNKTKVAYSRRLKEETEKAIQLDPKLDLAYYMLGRWHWEVANMNAITRGLAKMMYGGLPKASNEEALKNFKKASELAPKRIIHRWELAKTYLELDNRHQAIDQLKFAMKLTPQDKDDAEALKDVAKKLKDLKVPEGD